MSISVNKKLKYCATCNSWTGARDAKSASDPKKSAFVADKIGMCNNGLSIYKGKQVEYVKSCNKWSKWIVIT
ncbi:hypothetical protein [Hydrogenobaculum acidophilum]